MLDKTGNNLHPAPRNPHPHKVIKYMKLIKTNIDS